MLIRRQQFFEVIDFLHALFGRFIGNHLMHARDEHILIMRSVKNTDISQRRRFLMNPP